MSAIWGIIYKNQREISYSVTAGIQSALAHRSVDGVGVYHKNHVAFGNHKHITSIFQKNEQLPREEGRYVITNDSRIDNRQQLASLLQLQKKASQVSDSDLILESYKRWGKRCTEYLEGEFAFAIWDTQTEYLFMATDHIGFRSLYYHNSNDLFMFSSEIKGILAVKSPPHNFNKFIIPEYITANHSGRTFDKDIFTIPGGSYMVFNNNNFTIQIKKYWTLQKKDQYHFTNDKDWPDCLRELLTQAIRNRLHTDAPVGISLSGGLDSSFITALLALELQKQNKQLYTFSNILPSRHIGPEKDESFFIQSMCNHYPNICQTFIQLPADTGPFSDLEDTFYKTEALCYPFIYVDKALYASAREKGISMLFTGFGGDFTISNSADSMVYEMLKNGNFKQFYSYFFVLKNHYNISAIRAVKSFILDHSSLAKIYKPLLGKLKKDAPIRLNRELYNLVASKARFGGKGTIKEIFQQSVNSGTLGGVMFNTQKKLAAHYAIDSAVPIFDKKISEFFLDVPPEQFLLHGERRSLIKRAMEGIVPEEIRQRKDKSAFSPDFFRRFKQQSEYMYQSLRNARFKPANQFINIDKIWKDLDRLLSLPVTDSIPPQSRMTAWTIELISFINWLEKNGEVF